jgi:feruloyl esterase
MRKFAWVAGLLLASCTTQRDAAEAPAVASASPPATGRCAALVGRDFGPGIAITEAAEKPAAAPGTVQNGPAKLASGLPSYCNVTGVINQRTGADGKTYGIRFALA